MKRFRLPIGYITGVAAVLLVVSLVFLSRGSTSANDQDPVLKMPDFPPTPTVPAPPADASKPSGTRLLGDTFTSEGTLARWEFVDTAQVPADKANWVVENGQLLQDRTGLDKAPNTSPTMAFTGDPQWANYTVSTKVYDENNATFGLVARRQGNSFYRFRMNADSYPDTPKLVLEKVVDGVATPLVTSDGPGYTQHQWHTAALTVRGTAIQATVDGKVVAQATDSTLSSGQAGLYTLELGYIRFDDVTVAAP
jgi:hypothetical protein